MAKAAFAFLMVLAVGLALVGCALSGSSGKADTKSTSSTETAYR